VFVSVKETDKPHILAAAKRMVELGFSLIATDGTAAFLAREGVAVTQVNKVAQGRPHIVDRIVDGGVQLIFNTTEGWQSLKDSQAIREAAIKSKVPYFTTATASHATANAIGALRGHALEVRSLQSYYSASKH
jgi:carbamoyl-phosphate synthase large subunit